jgi:glycosyltransferase involved in cell wall biosynthesis
MTLNQLATGLVHRGHRVRVFRPRQTGERRRAGDTFVDAHGVEQWLVRGMPIPLYRSLRMGLPVVPTLRKHFKTASPDVVHVATEGPLGLAALSAAGRFKLPVTSSFHTNFHQYAGDYGLRAGRGIALRYLRWFHNRTRLTLVPTDQMRADLAAEGFQRLSVLARGVDAELFSPSRRSQALREAWGAGPDDPVLIYVGRLAAEKNLRLVVQTFLAWQKELPRARCVLVGDGPEADALRAKYPQFHYAGTQRGKALAEHYASADIFVFPSTTETFGNVITEAMASGLVVLAFDYAAARQYIVSGKNGYTAPLGDSAAFSDAAARVSLNPLEWTEVRAAARATALTITWEAIISRFETELATACDLPVAAALR